MALQRRFRSLMLQHRRLFSSSDQLRWAAAMSVAPLILVICRSAALPSELHLDRLVFSKAISTLRELNHHDGIRAFIHDSINHTANRYERYAALCIIMYGQGGLINDAVNLFDKMPELGIHRIVKTLNSCSSPAS